MTCRLRASKKDSRLSGAIPSCRKSTEPNSVLSRLSKHQIKMSVIDCVNVVIIIIIVVVVVVVNVMAVVVDANVMNVMLLLILLLS